MVAFRFACVMPLVAWGTSEGCHPDGQCFVNAGFDSQPCCSGNHPSNWISDYTCKSGTRCGPGSELETSPHNNTNVNAADGNGCSPAYSPCNPHSARIECCRHLTCGATGVCAPSVDETLDESANRFRDRSLFIGPFYALDEAVVAQSGFDDVSGRFREAYCIARHQGDRESYTTVFNTVVATPDGPHHPRYYTREEFDDGKSFNVHLNNVANAFANAKGVSVPTGFFALGTQNSLDDIHENAQHNDITLFTKDRRSFKKTQFKGDDYFSIDFFVDVPAGSLQAFRTAWAGARNAAIANDGVLAFAMGIHQNEDGSYKAVCQETYASAAAYSDWLPIAHPHVSAILDAGSVSDHPNPFTMAGSAEQLTSVKDTCDGLPFTCIQYTFDTCEGVGDAVDVVV